MKRLVLVALAGVLVAVPSASAANMAFDAANDAAYDDGWQSGDNGGSGFAPWDLQAIDFNGDSATNAGFFIASSTENGDGDTNGDGDIDTGNEAFGLFANSGDFAAAIRPFTGGPLGPGQTFSIQMDNGFIDDGAVVGFALVTSTADPNAIAANFSFRGGESSYQIGHAGGFHDTGIPFTDEGLTVDIRLDSQEDFTLSVNALPFFSGQLLNTDGIVGVGLGNGFAGSGPSRNAYFNSLSVRGVPIPEPSALALAALVGCLGAAVMTRRRPC